MPVIGVESMVTRAGLRYTREYLTPGICSLIKPVAMEKLMLFRAKIHTVMLQYITTHCGLVTPFGDMELDQHWLS